MELVLQQMPIVVHSLNIGFLQTLRLFFVTLIGAFPLGLIIAFGSMSQFKPLSYFTKMIVWIVRGTPLMIMQILTAFALLIPAFSLLYTPQPLALLFHRVYNAPLPNVLLHCLSFGVRFSPVKFSAQRRSTSELLRTL